MAQNYSPRIVQDSLVMCLDASQNKSYPTDLPVKNGLALWLDAADDSTFSYSSGTSVSQWRDKSGNNRHFFQATAGNQPSRSAVINSRKAIQFTAASGQYLRYNSTIINNRTGGSVFVVWRTAGETSQYSQILDNYHGGANAQYAGFQMERNSTADQYYWGFQDTGYVAAGNIPATSYSNGTTYCYWITKDLTTITGGYNGISVTPSSSPSSTWTEDTKGWLIGCWGSNTDTFSRYFNGIQCEVIIFNRGLSDTERKQVNTYLGQKWGISNTDRSIVDLAGNDDNGLFGNGTVANMPAYDYYNKGTLKFDGSNDYVSVGANAILRGNSISLGVFFKTINNGQSVQFIAGYGDTGVQGYWLGVVGGPIRFFVGNGSTSLQLNSGISPNNDQIYYVVGTYDGTNQRIYVDGVLMASSTSVNGSLSYTGMTDGFLIGQVQGFTGGRYLTGNIYAMQVYNRALSAVEVAQNYEAQKSKFANTIVQQGLVLNLDAGNPYSYAGAGSDWFDVSGNNNTSLLVGTTLPTFSNTNGGILIYDGNTQYSRTPSPSNNFAWTPSGVGLNNMTIDLWIKTTDGSGTILSKPWSGNGEYNFGLGHQGFSIVIGNQTNTLGFSSILTGNWINLVIVVSPTQYGAYINGVQNTALTNHGITNNTPTYGNGQIELTLMTLYPYGGGGNAGFSTQGNIGSFRIYNRVLTAAEVLQNYNATKGRFGL